MSFTCTNGTVHKHDLVYEARVCYGLVRPPTQPIVSLTSPPITDPQKDYIRDLGGDLTYAAKLSKKEASVYIKQLLRGGPVSQAPAAAPQPPTQRAARPVDPRLELLSALLPQVRDGYFATQADAVSPVRFIRISTPKPGKSQISKAARKVQTQHGPRWENAAALWPGGKWSVFDSRVVEQLMLAVSDPRGCMKRYAKELGHCCRCNTELTDERSRHYGIGPECEKHWPDVIQEIDDENDGKPYEYLVR